MGCVCASRVCVYAVAINWDCCVTLFPPQNISWRKLPNWKIIQSEACIPFQFDPWYRFEPVGSDNLSTSQHCNPCKLYPSETWRRYCSECISVIVWESWHTANAPSLQKAVYQEIGVSVRLFFVLDGAITITDLFLPVLLWCIILVQPAIVAFCSELFFC